VAADSALLRSLQQRLIGCGVPLYWLVDVPLSHPAFGAVQWLAATGVWPGAPDRLTFEPEREVTAEALAAETTLGCDRCRALFAGASSLSRAECALRLAASVGYSTRP
jgi:hypothetical protein